MPPSWPAGRPALPDPVATTAAVVLTRYRPADLGSVNACGRVLDVTRPRSARRGYRHPAFLEAHLDRLYEGAALLLDVGRSRAQLTAELYRTLRANDMTDGVHVRLMQSPAG